MKKQLEALRNIEEADRRRPLAEKLADIDSGKYWSDLRKQLDAAGLGAEVLTVGKLCDCDIYVNGDQIAYEVTQTFPEVSKEQVFIWLCGHAGEHHEVYGTI